MPKFHSRFSLIIGTLAGFAMAGLMVLEMLKGFKISYFFAFLLGTILAFHCVDMLFYYKKHRIVKIEKMDDKRIIYKK